MAEAVYRHYLARDEEEHTQKIFNRHFRARYEGTREEDLNWIINKIKVRLSNPEYSWTWGLILVSLVLQPRIPS